jgi:hypothetical protein
MRVRRHDAKLPWYRNKSSLRIHALGVFISASLTLKMGLTKLTLDHDLFNNSAIEWVFLWYSRESAT